MFYVVTSGWKPGVYDDYEEALKQTDGYPASELLSFKSREDALFTWQYVEYANYLRMRKLLDYNDNE